MFVIIFTQWVNNRCPKFGGSNRVFLRPLPTPLIVRTVWLKRCFVCVVIKQ